MGTSTWSTYLCNQSSASRSKVITHFGDRSIPECITPLRIQNDPDVLRAATNGVISRTYEAWHPVPPLERWSPARDAHLSAPPIRGGENHALMCDRVPSFGPSPAPRSITGIKECVHRHARPLAYARQISPQFRPPATPARPRPRPRPPPRPRRPGLPHLRRQLRRELHPDQNQAMVPSRRKAHFHIRGRIPLGGSTSSSSSSRPRSAGRSPSEGPPTPWPVGRSVVDGGPGRPAAPAGGSRHGSRPAPRSGPADPPGPAPRRRSARR